MKNFIKNILPAKLLESYQIFKRRKEVKYYKGHNVMCPICNSTFKTFAPGGLNKRENARCLKCQSVERHRLLYLYLIGRSTLFSNPSKTRVLHFAPEKSFYDIFTRQTNIEYFPCDLNPDLYSYRGEVKIEKVDICNIPFAENNFDVILCNHVLEHIIDDIKAIGELYRVMKKGGWGIFQVPIDYSRNATYEDFTITTQEGREKSFGQKDHVRLYGRDYKNRLASCGFNVIEDNYVKSFSSEDIFKYGLQDFELIYLCKK